MGYCRKWGVDNDSKEFTMLDYVEESFVLKNKKSYVWCLDGKVTWLLKLRGGVCECAWIKNGDVRVGYGTVLVCNRFVLLV